jgi:hypothetical protein
MAFKRSAVRSRLAPPLKNTIISNEGICGFLPALKWRPFSAPVSERRDFDAVVIPVGTPIAERPPGRRRRSPASGSHRTWREAFPHPLFGS